VIGVAGRVFVRVALAVSLVSPAAAALAANCPDLAYGTPAYQQKMDELAGQARLPGAAWNRYHEAVVAALCAEEPADVDELVDSGSIPADEAGRIAAALGKPYRPKQTRSEFGKKISLAKTELIEMGVCAACADQIAQYYARRPSSRCAKRARRALAGDSRAIDELVDFPAYCRWAYPGERR
jgi:hypothetical protein